MVALKICPTCSTEYEPKERFCPRDGSALRTQGGATDLIGQVVAERYHVLRKLGEGGMGQVYLAEHVKMGRKSALKVMHASMGSDPDAISRFNREAANASRINHPNVAAVYDFGETPEGLIYLAMEYVEGRSLTTVLEETGALPVQRVAKLVAQTADALAAAHDMGIVHRDLKPDNIMIARNRDGSDCVKVVDFGIAKAGADASQKVTRTGLVVGTPEYMSPEQLAGDTIDGRSDVYSLGLVAFNLLTGTLPFPSESAQESMIMRLTDRPRTLSEMRPDITWHPALQQVMDRVLARAAAERYAAAPEFARDLASAVARMPASALHDDGTLVIGAVTSTTVVPPTQARSARPSAPTMPMPAPSAAPIPVAAHLPVRSRMPLAASLGALTVVLLAGAGYLTTRDRASESTARSDTGVAAATAATPARDSSAATPSDVASTATPSSSPATVNARSPNVAASGSPNPMRSAIEERIERMEQEILQAASDTTKARALLREIDDNLPSIRRPAPRLLALKARGDLLIALGEAEDACAQFDSIRRDKTRMPDHFRRAVDFYYTKDSGPACQ